MRRPIFRRFAKARAANAAIEFALIVPIMVAIFGGIVEFGRAFQVYGATNRLASRYALAWADCSDSPTSTPPTTCQSELPLYTPAATLQNLVPQLTNAITLRMIEVTMAGGVASPLYASPSGATLTPSELTAAQGIVPTGQSGVVVVVTVTYTHTLVFFQQIMAPILGASRTISYTVAQLKS